MSSSPELEETVELEVHCPVETRVLGIIRVFMASLAAQMGFAAEQADQIEMAVDEACANVVRHAYKHLGVSPDLPEDEQRSGVLTEAGYQCVLRLRVILNPDYIRVQIRDHGIGKKNRPPGVASLEEYLEREGRGGLGGLIIRNFMDEVSYDYPDSGTVLTMTKYLTPRS